MSVDANANRAQVSRCEVVFSALLEKRVFMIHLGRCTKTLDGKRRLAMSVDEFSTSEAKRPHWLFPFWRSTVGKKVVMALTGAMGVGYLAAHMMGNLQVFEGAGKINAYADLLKSNMGLLWMARSVLSLPSVCIS